MVAFLNAGATVIAPVRSHGGERALLEDVEWVFSRSPSNLHIVVVPDYATIHGMRSLVSVLRERGHKTIHHVVSSFGGPFPKGHLSVLSPENIHSALDRAIPHMILTQNMMDLVAADSSKSSFTFISGLLGEKCHMPHCAALSVANGALYSIIRAFEAECSEKNKDLRINEIRIGALMKKDGKSDHPFVVSGTAYPSSLIGKELVKIAAGTIDREIVRLTPQDMECRLKEEVPK